MENRNPFTIQFGVTPFSYISRISQSEEILDNLKTSYTGCMHLITGIRGSGKTVFMTHIVNSLEKEKNWIVISLNPELDLYRSACSKLNKILKGSNLRSKLSFSYKDITVGLESEQNQYELLETELEELLKLASNREKKVIFAIDEISNSDEVKKFLHSFQIYIRENLAVYIIATGLPNNISSLANYKTLTFLQRAERTHMDPLDLGRIRNEYKELLGVSDEIAVKMSKLTRGYSYAYQLLGNLVWKNNKMYDESLLLKYDDMLAEYTYNKIYSEMSERDLLFLRTIFNNNITTVRELISVMGITAKEFSVYRDRLIKKGLIISRQRGQFEIVLPRFKEYLKNRELFENVEDSLGEIV